jgi:hypothetical protein
MSQLSYMRARIVGLLLVVLAVLGLIVSLTPAARAVGDPAQGPGGPILVITSASSGFGKYYAEILRTEGLNSFAVRDIASVTPEILAEHDVVVLDKMPLASAQVTMLSNWVNGGGNLIAMAPDPQLAGLLGIAATGSTLSDRYLLIDTSASPGAGLVDQTIQFHGTADLYNLVDATPVATLYSTATAATGNPAVTLRSAGSGKAAAFAYDLAASIVYTRQGNPAWATQERDGFAPIRSNDKFFGAAAGDPKPDWIDLSKVAIPQADEQQRLLANLILEMNSSKKPLPRFWYFPNGKKAVVIMTGDDHGNGGTVGRFEQFKSLSPAGCSVADWECVRGTSYVYTHTPMSDAQAGQFVSEGFEVGVHINTSCANYDLPSLQATYDQQVPQFLAKYTSVGPLLTQRHHCIVWSDWSSGAQVQLSHGMRLDTSYYYWPPSWVGNVPGLFTGSAMPMRFVKSDGSLIDVYMAATQMTDESGQTYPFTVDTLLDRAVGPQGYFGAYTVNAHTDAATIPESNAVVSSALARGVPIVSAKQMLTWLDARNSSSFGAVGYSAGTLTFSVTKDPAANGLRAMLPTRSGTRALGAISRGGNPVNFTVSVVKGVEYAFFAADPGTYVAAYADDASGPGVSSVSPAAGATGVSVDASVTATFSEAMTASTINTTTFELRNAANSLVGATVAYDAGTRTATLTPSGPLGASETYTATVRGGGTDPRVKDLAGNALAASVSWSFTTGTPPPPPSCPCGGFDSSATPTNPQIADPNPVELGVRFRANVDGFVTGVRFYKGTGNTGTHIGNLWSANGALLARAQFTGESASGWQQVSFSTPVAVSANTVYVVSYFAPNGNYAGDGGFFAASGVDNGPIRLLQDGENGGNGVYQYASSTAFPSSTFNSTNYWVDVVFTLSGPADTTPPTVTAVSPLSGATGVATAATVTATFSEAVDPATVGTSTFELRTAANVLVASTVSYDAATRRATLTPNAALAASATYTATVRGGAADPRIKDVAGNALAASSTWSFTTAASGGGGGGCASPANAIVAENCLTGNLASEWDVNGVGDPSIQGFATNISVNRGSTVSFKVSTTASNYRFDIYRMGYYAGRGARRVATVQPSATLPQSQPNCLNQAATGLIDCGNWSVSGSWAVPANAVSGIYFAKLVRADTAGASHIVFVVRDDASTSDLLFQTSDTTWQAYNSYGGNSLYVGSPAGRAYKVSYNRPFNTRVVDGGQDWVFNAEYPMVRWLEANGYDVSYSTGVDSDRAGALLLNHKTFLSVGHDEYWSGAQRANVEAARNAGVNLAFFSGNEVFWKTRWENSIDGSGTPYRTLVTYKETIAGAKIDPNPAWTGTWRDPRFSPPADGGRPENGLTGTIFAVNAGTSAIRVPEADGKMRLWRNTSVANLSAGNVAVMPNGTLGYEWDIDSDNGARPPGLIRMSSTTVSGVDLLLDFGSSYGPGTATHHLTLYRHSSGARVFGAGTIQWAWGLDANHDRSGTPSDVRMQQATVNLLADMNAQPATLQAGLVAATASTDATPPTSTITSPTSGATVVTGTATTISGTAADTGGGVVGGVEVSVDGGATWRPASGRATWTYAWTPTVAGSVTLRSRAADDSGNLQTPTPGVTVTVGQAPPQTCPCTIWPASAVPSVPSDPDTGAVNLGVKFTSDQNGFITGIRFYKGTGNTGTHVGTLWTSGGAQLASKTFTAETASGWQQVDFDAPVAVTAGTVYVASYHAPNGRYAGDNGYFSAAATDNPPLHALRDGTSGGNGVYAYGPGTLFPTSTFNASNYWVDVVFTTSGTTDTTPPTVTAVSPASGATGIATNTAVTATFSEPIDATTVGSSTFELRGPGGALIAATVAYNGTTRVATLTPGAALSASTTYTATVKGGAADPRVKDTAGNALAADRVWSFTTAAGSDTTAPTVTARSPAPGATGVAATANVTATFSEAMDATTIDTNTFQLRDAANALVAATVSFNATTRVATLDPSPTLLAAAVYTATLRGGATDPRVKDAAGNALAADASWSFTVASAPAPTVTSTSPASGATGVSPTSNILVNFSTSMNATTINTNTLELRDPSNALVPVSITYSSTLRRATINPSPALTQLATYTVIVKGGPTAPHVTDTAGTPLAANVTWSFTIVADTTPPTVSSIAPSDGATNVSRTPEVRANFSEAMDPATINTNTMELRGPSNVLVPSTVSYSSSNRRASLRPVSALARATTYTVTVRGGTTDPRVKDVAGNAMAVNRTWSFTTRP